MVESKNPIVNFFRSLVHQFNISTKSRAESQVFPSNGNTKEKLIEKVETQRKIFLDSK